MGTGNLERFDTLEELVSNPRRIAVRSWDNVLEREVVLQLPAPHSGGSPDRQLREARMLARVAHPGVVRLLEVVETTDGPVLVLEPRSGETLLQRLQRDGRLAPQDARRLGVTLAGALSAIHAEGVLHRGVSEDNVLLEPDGGVALTGFEFSKRLDPEHRQTSLDLSHSVKDSLPVHLAPEQLHGQPADARSDIYALGCVLYRCVTGRPAFTDPLAVRSAPPDVRELAPDVPRDLADAIRRCMDASPMGRFQSMDELSAELTSAQVTPSRSRAARQSDSWWSSPWLRPRMVSVVGLALAAGLVWMLAPQDRNVPVGRNSPGTDPAPSIAAAGYHNYYAGSHALLIGIDYGGGTNEFPPLNNAQRDVEMLAGELASIGWPKENIRVLVGPEATRNRIEDELQIIENDRNPDDQLFIYYAGHGVKHHDANTSGWAIPSDATGRPQPNRIGSNWLEFGRFEKVFEHTRAKHVLIALDCCHSGVVARGGPQGTRRFYRGLLKEKAHQLLASARPNERAWDGDGAHSPFALGFFDAIAQARAEGAVTSSEVRYLAHQALKRNQERMKQFSVMETFGTTADFVFMDLNTAQ